MIPKMVLKEVVDSEAEAGEEDAVDVVRVGEAEGVVAVEAGEEPVWPVHPTTKGHRLQGKERKPGDPVGGREERKRWLGPGSLDDVVMFAYDTAFSSI